MTIVCVGGNDIGQKTPETLVRELVEKFGGGGRWLSSAQSSAAEKELDGYVEGIGLWRGGLTLF